MSFPIDPMKGMKVLLDNADKIREVALGLMRASQRGAMDATGNPFHSVPGVERIPLYNAYEAGARFDVPPELPLFINSVIANVNENFGSSDYIPDDDEEGLIGVIWVPFPIFSLIKLIIDTIQDEYNYEIIPDAGGIGTMFNAIWSAFMLDQLEDFAIPIPNRFSFINIEDLSPTVYYYIGSNGQPVSVSAYRFILQFLAILLCAYLVAQLFPDLGVRGVLSIIQGQYAAYKQRSLKAQIDRIEASLIRIEGNMPQTVDVDLTSINATLVNIQSELANIAAHIGYKLMYI